MIRFCTRARKVEHKTRLVRTAHDGRCETEDLGVAVLLEGSWEWLFVEDEPGFAAGDVVEVTIARCADESG